MVGAAQVVAARTHEDGTATSRVLYELKSAHGSDVSWMHDLAVTDRHLVLVEQPLVYSLKVRHPGPSSLPRRPHARSARMRAA